MTSHDPETLRRIMLLLKGKKKIGRTLGKEVAKGHGKVRKGGMLQDPEEGSFDYHKPVALDKHGQDPMDVPLADSWLSQPNQRDPEYLKILQLLDSGLEAGDKVRGKLGKTKTPWSARDTRNGRQKEIQLRTYLEHKRRVDQAQGVGR